jgi:hypothetical protein
MIQAKWQDTLAEFQAMHFLKCVQW